LADSSVNILVRPWVKSGDYWTLYFDFHKNCKEAFDAAGIDIPFPQTVVHLEKSDA
jgi:small conductance mechanosensitive channel